MVFEKIDFHPIAERENLRLRNFEFSEGRKMEALP